MAEADNNINKAEIRIPKEHGHLDYLLSQIPKKAQKGMLLQCDLNLMSMDVNDNFIVLGSNVGVIFLYNRKSKELERLRTHSHHDTITCVALHSGLEQQIAAATEKGVVYLFQLPSQLPSHSKQLQQFVVKDVHKSEITCMCWSLNGMKLFSGDKKGQVSCVEVDFYSRVCETNICLIENNSEIVQLNHAHKALLISTNQRTIIYRTDIKMGLVQVGQKERKINGKFGAVFLPGLCKPEDAEMYACRPGLRIWKSKMDGSVQNTYLFKELISNPYPKIDLLPFQHKAKMFLPDGQFGPLYLYKDKFIVTWFESSLFILNPLNTSVICGTLHVGNIRTVAVTNDEIFVLRKETDRNVIRLGERPESLAGNTYHRLVKDNNMPDFVKDPQVKDDQPSSSPLQYLKENIVDKLKNIDSPTEKVSSVSNLASVVGGHSPVGKVMSDKDLPPVVKLDSDDLLTVEIFSGNPTKEMTSSTEKSPIRQDRFNPFMKEDSHDEEVDTSELSSKTGLDCKKSTQDSVKQSEMNDSGTFSLQSSSSSHDIPSGGTPIGHGAVKPQTPVGQSTVKQQTHAGNHSNSPDSLSRIQAIPITTPCEDIAVSVKTKKKKKKKTDMKHIPAFTDPNKLSANVDSDTLSQNSFDGEMSDQSKNSEKSCDTSATPVTTSTAVDISDIVGLKPKKDDVMVTKLESSSETQDSSSLPEKCEQISNSGKQEEILSDKKQTLEDKIESIPTFTVQSVVTDTLNSQNSKSCDKLSDAQSEIQGEKGDKVLMKNQVQSGKPSEPIPNISNQPSPKATKVTEKKTLPETKPNTLQTVTANSVFSQNDSHSLGIAENVLKHSKKQRSFSKLEKNLAHLEEELLVDSYDSGVTENKNVGMQGKTVNKTISGEASIASGMFNLSSIESESDKSLDSPRQESGTVKLPASPTAGTIYQTSSGSLDDFYSKYNTSPSQNVSISEEVSEHPLSNVEAPTELKEASDDKTESIHICDRDVAMKSKVMLALNNWMEVYVTGNLQSLDISDNHVWCTDRSSNIWYCSLRTPGIKWIKSTGGYAKQISVSRSGMIVWRLYKDTVYAGTKITPKHPEGMKWVEAVKDVKVIAVDNACAWYVKSNGDVAIQKGLSKDRPCYKSTLIEKSSYSINHITARDGVVWAITDQCKLIYRAGIKNFCPEGKEWAEYTHPDGMMFSHVCFGDGNVAWAVDILGRIYFMTCVTMETPIGDSCWWQVPVHTEVAVTDFTLLDSLRSLTKVFDPKKLADLISSQKGGLIASGADGVWMCPEFKNTLIVCKGSIEGHYWNEVLLTGIVASTAWKLLSVAALHLEWGLVWIQQPNGDIFTFSATKRSVKTVDRPIRGQFICLSVCEDAIWGLHEEGKVFIREGVGEHCPEGAKWCDLDLKQLGEAQLVHLSCGTRNVWAVDSDGVIYQRIGVKAPSSHSLQAAWLPVDSGPSGTTFLQVYNGPTDNMVWAVDNRRQTFVRLDVTDDMPIGTSWLHIPGIQVQQLAISESFVWALDPNGEILCRHGITKENPGGDFWRKIPGVFSQISCSKNDELWAINHDGLIFSRQTKYLLRKDLQTDQRQRNSSSISIAEDWELI